MGPNQAAYEEKFKEVQQAYQIIMDQRQGKGTGGTEQARKTSGDSAALADMEARDRDRPDRAKARTINICVLRSVISKTDISEKV